MAVDIKIPSVGESVTEGTISRWLKKNGEFVQADEPILELETDKATGELPAPASGTLVITVQEGQTIAIDSVVGRIEEAGAAKPAAEKGEQKHAATVKSEDKDGRGRNDADAARPAPASPATREVALSPAARRLAREGDIDVTALKGSGAGGRITKDDVLAQLERRKGEQKSGAPVTKSEEESQAETKAPPAAAGLPVTERETRQRMSSIRQRIAERLVASQNSTATLTTFNEADMSAVSAWRLRHGDQFKAKHGISLGLMPFFVKASVDALRAFPNCNARIDGSDVIHHHYFNIGVAVATERGLMVPVIRDADRLSFADIEKRIAELVQKARDGKISVDDLQGGTFTITNGGVFGSLLSTPILNPPQTAILGMHMIQRRPVAVDDQVVIRPMMYLALSYDHRLIDGREAVLFLTRTKECVENPERLLLET
jgi:2-oxoglutarate dehydrogenase E2 component (dihydrolipoamide succinyltransferase)